MRHTPIKQTLVAVALATLALQAAAHRAWLLPTATVVEAKEPWVAIDGAISENLFDFDHNPLKLDAIAITEPDGAAGVLPAITMGKVRSSFDLKMAKNGTYKVALVSKTVTASYKVNGELKRFRGNEEAFAKDVPAKADELRTIRTHARLETFVTANKANMGAFKPSGVGLELVPLTDPTDLRTGEVARWRFLLDGKPLPNFAFSLIPGAVRYRGVLGEIRLVTDANGEANVTLPAPGMVWLNASYPAVQAKGPVAADAPAEQRRFTYAATLEVLPE